MPETATACQAIEEDLSALIDEELAPEREAELRAHLATCDRCARRLEELCNVDLALASLPAPEVAWDLRVQLAERIAEHERRAALSAPAPRREERLRQAPPPRRRRWLGRQVAALAALAAAALLAVFATLRSGEAPVPDAPQIAWPAPLEAAGTPPAVGLEELADEDLVMLLVLDAVEDLEVVANLELLEDLLELEGMEGAG